MRGAVPRSGSCEYTVVVHSSPTYSALVFPIGANVTFPGSPYVKAWVYSNQSDLAHFYIYFVGDVYWRQVGYEIVDMWSWRVSGRAEAPLTAEVVEGPLTGVISWLHDQSPVAECDSNTHRLSLRAIQ